MQCILLIIYMLYTHYRYVPDESKGLLYYDTCAQAEGWHYTDIE